MHVTPATCPRSKTVCMPSASVTYRAPKVCIPSTLAAFCKRVSKQAKQNASLAATFSGLPPCNSARAGANMG